MDLGVDLIITQLIREWTVRTTWPHVHPHGPLPPTERLNQVTEKGLYPLSLLAATIE
jgi:hypothetical protein